MVVMNQKQHGLDHQLTRIINHLDESILYLFGSMLKRSYSLKTISMSCKRKKAVN